MAGGLVCTYFKIFQVPESTAPDDTEEIKEKHGEALIDFGHID